MPYFFILSITTYIFYIILKTRKQINILSKNNYNLKKYNKWITQNKKETLLTPELLGIIIIILTFFLNIKLLGIIICAFYLILSLIELRKDKKIKPNKKNKLTIIINTIIYLIILILICLDYHKYMTKIYYPDNTKYYYIIIIILGYISYYITLLSAKITNQIKRKA